MTMTQGRLLVTCVGGFACTEWELHNGLNTERRRESRQSLWPAQQFEMRVNFMNLVMEQLHVVEDGEVAVFLLIQTSICHINTLHNCCGSLYNPNPEILGCACGSQFVSERR